MEFFTLTGRGGVKTVNVQRIFFYFFFTSHLCYLSQENTILFYFSSEKVLWVNPSVKYPHFFLTLPLPKKTSKTGICNYISTLGENSAPRCVRSNKKINDFIINKVCTNLVKKTFSLKVKLELYSDKQTRCLCRAVVIFTSTPECGDQNQLESCCGGGWWWYELNL